METLVAIHWHGSVLRIAAAHVDEGVVRVHKLIERSLPESADLAMVREELSNVVAAENLKGHDAAVVVDREQFEMRQLTLPQVPDEELPDIVRFQAKNNFTAFGENDIVDYIRLGSAQSGNQAQLLAATLSASELKSIRGMLESARLKLKHIIPRPFATVNLIQSELTGGNHQLIVNEFGDEADLSVVYRNLIVLTRSIRLPHEAAEKDGALIREIRRTIAASRNQPLGGTIERIVIVGDDQAHGQLAAVIDHDLKLPVRVVPVGEFLAVEPGAKPAAAADNGSRAPLFGALKWRSEPAAHLIDFAMPRRRPEPQRDMRRWYLVGGGAAALALMALLMTYFLIASRRSEIADLQAKLDGLKSQTKDAGRLLGDVGLIDQWKRGDINWLDELSDISARLPLPDDVIVKSFNGSVQTIPFQGKISLSGLLADADIENDVVRQLQERPYTVAPGPLNPTDELPPYKRTFSLTLAIPLANAKIDSIVPEVVTVAGDEQPAEASPDTSPDTSDSKPEEAASPETANGAPSNAASESNSKQPPRP